MKPKKSSGDFREDNDTLKGKKKHKLTPIKKQKSKRTQFLDEIEEFDDIVFDYKANYIEDLYDDIDNFEDDEDDEDDEDF